MTDLQWEDVLSRVGVVLNFGIEKKQQVKNNRLARLIAATPYLAGSSKALETSFSHLLIYSMSLDESVKDFFFHKEEDDNDIYSRLFPISSFYGGDSEIIQCCMDLIALCMISNYKNDAEDDKLMGKYNPLNQGTWEYETISVRLMKNIKKTVTNEISQIYTIDDALKGYWG